MNGVKTRDMGEVTNGFSKGTYIAVNIMMVKPTGKECFLGLMEKPMTVNG